MWKLIAVRQEALPNFPEARRHRLVAYFTDDVDADNYVRKARLKHPIKRDDGTLRIFKKNSLLANYEDAYIVQHVPNTSIPIDPVI